MASEVVKENVEIAPPSPYANNDTFDATNDEFDDYNEDVTDEVLEEKDDLVQVNVEDIKEEYSETEEVVSARFDEFFEGDDEEEGVGPETIPPAEPISVEVIIAIDEKGIIILHSLTPISTLMHSQVASQWG